MLAVLVQRAPTQATPLKGVTHAQLAMSASVKQEKAVAVLILTDPQSRTIIWVTNVPKATTALKDLTRRPSVRQARTILSKEERKNLSAFCANLALSRMNGARKAAKCAASTPTRQRELPFATVLERTELIPLETPRAVARVASTTSTTLISQRVPSVTSQIVSHWCMKTVRLMPEELDSPMEHASHQMSVKMLAMVSLVLAQRYSESALAPTKSMLMKSATRTAVRMPQS